MRFMIEDMGPELHQYLVESDTDGRPFNRDTRAIIYERAKGVTDTKPFGTEQDVYTPGYTFLKHSIATRPVADDPVPGPADHGRRRAVPAAVLALGPEHLGDELRRAGRQRRARDEHRRQEGQLRPRHGRGRHLPLPPRWRRRPDLADRHRLLRVPQAGGRLRSRSVREERDGPAGQDDRDQGLPGREARPRRHPSRREGDRGDRRGAAGRGRQDRVLADLPHGVLDPARDDRVHHASCASSAAASRSASRSASASRASS